MIPRCYPGSTPPLPPQHELQPQPPPPQPAPEPCPHRQEPSPPGAPGRPPQEQRIVDEVRAGDAVLAEAWVDRLPGNGHVVHLPGHKDDVRHVGVKLARKGAKRLISS